MDELQTIRAYFDGIESAAYPYISPETALAALSRLEARAAEWPDTAELVDKIREGRSIDNGEFIETEYDNSLDVCGTLIGQYAYRYSEDIRKDRDEWRDLAKDFALAVQSKEAIK